MSGLRVIGLAGWSGAGKTTLLSRLIPLLVTRGVRVATLKHAHHGFDVDHPGKDSHIHRQAGAREVIVSSSRRWAQIREVAEGDEARLPDLLRRLTPEGLALVEGFKRESHAKLEVFRAANGRPPIFPDDPRIVGIASDVPFPEAGVPVVGLDDIAVVADLVLSRAEPLETVLARLESV
ncbi:molybdopterin-guanine dinucleotide biosynthesis protein MobB [Methylobacterium sp. Leaf456]|uniref:molybdopterin-guanine dinucleotide biosynthesis protein B n=1 Tax=Methylobacterium sp. Leaf456 TaxID=1736382 RepID=UPI0007001348|nr:molybdopterin-guanine dinucleotide biosynthesis protein B [Methylobacterium sp. Leaf456]KQT56915.1 molybdopterin-guanine dinucleotide biosynthesis protein MobB [Methylobacterium sp. Leaf456]